MNTSAVSVSYLNVQNAALFTMVCLPCADGRFPTVILRNPYVDADEHKSVRELCKEKTAEFARFLAGGFAVVYQHCRGRGKSSGDCIPYIHEREDGLFLQDWVRTQPFYNGELYLHGHSYTASVHFVTAPFAADIKGAVFSAQDCERYNCNYRNGFYKMGLHGRWYVEKMYKQKTMPTKNYRDEDFHMLPLSDFSKKVLGEPAEDFDEILRHPDRTDPFWQSRYGGGEAHEAVKHANIPILFLTGFYDIYTGGVFQMWNTLDDDTKSKCALVVHPFQHSGTGNGQPIFFENGVLAQAFENHDIRWLSAIREGTVPPFALGKVTYYQLFANHWHCDDFASASKKKFPLGTETVTYRYDPKAPATFKGGLSDNFGGTAWQDPPHSRGDIITVYTPAFTEDTLIKGKMGVKLKVRSDCEDTCFYVRISLCKQEGDFGLRDDINQISNFSSAYVPGDAIRMDFSFDEHAFIVQKGEKLRIDISSSAFPHYVRHTNNKGLFSAQTDMKIAHNTVILGQSFLELPCE